MRAVKMRKKKQHPLLPTENLSPQQQSALFLETKLLHQHIPAFDEGSKFWVPSP
jgi:hypothetical protein